MLFLPTGDPDPRPAFVKAVVGNVHYLHFAIISWVITMVIAVTVSIMTEPIPPECVSNLSISSCLFNQNSSNSQVITIINFGQVELVMHQSLL